MKHFALTAIAALTLFACNTKEEAPEETTELAVVEYEYYGDSTMTADEAVSATELITFLDGRDSVPVKIAGTIAEVCQKKGCWMSVDLNENESMHVSYNYEFLLPKNCGGKDFVMQGTAFFDTIPVSHLRHLAEDAGKSEEEINTITEAKPTLAFLATGVMIKKN